MLLHGIIRSILFAGLMLASNWPHRLFADEAKQEWLRGSGKDLQIRLKGEAVDDDGQAAHDIRVTGKMNDGAGNPQWQATVDGHRFEVWIPVNQSNWYSMWLQAESTKSGRVAYVNLNAHELRQAAIDGIKLTLKSPTRRLVVKVLDKGKTVPHAWVKVQFGFSHELRSRTDADGIAHFELVPEEALSGLMAWTDDYRIGGYAFDRQPTRNPQANEHIVELSHCRDQKLRLIDENGAPVPAVEFVIQMATPAPNYNYLGTNENSRIMTDAAGEVVYKWFPDWANLYFYVELKNKRWILDGDHQTVDDAVVFKLKRSQIAFRKRVSGRIEPTIPAIGGFFVKMTSFQGEQKRHSDVISAFTDANGTFSVALLPDATYCAYVLDSRWVGQIVDLIPYQSAGELITAPSLTVLEGQDVELMVTSGPQKRPFPNLTIYLFREHQFTWLEDGKTKHGTGGPQWWATTDAAGRATARAIQGKLQASVFTPTWRTEQSVDVINGQPREIRLHRDFDEKQLVTGRLVLANGLDTQLSDSEITVASVDGQYNDYQTLKCGPDGSFSFETLSSEIGIFASTQNGRAAGWMISKKLQTPIELELRPTIDFEGQLLADGARPVAGHRVQAAARVAAKNDFKVRLFQKSFEAKRLSTKTDSNGNFTLRNVPAEIEVSISADALDDPNISNHLDHVYLEPNENRARTVFRLETSAAASSKAALADRYQTTLRDCALSGFHMMVVISGESGLVKKFVNQNFMDYETNPDVGSFMQLAISGKPDGLSVADSEFLNVRSWPLPREDHIVACAFDAQGRELGRLEFDPADKSAADAVAEFTRRHAPVQVDAEDKWKQVFLEAKRSNRRVWARISQRYCGPCFRLSRWLDDQRELLEKDYVMLKIDDVRDRNGTRVAERLTRGQHHGVPFFAIFDESGAMLIDSAGPLGNIGFPSGFEGKKQLRKMLIQTRQTLINDEIQKLVDSIDR